MMNFLQLTTLRIVSVNGVFSLYLNIRGLQPGPGHFCGLLESPGFLSVKEWEPWRFEMMNEKGAEITLGGPIQTKSESPILGSEI